MAMLVTIAMLIVVVLMGGDGDSVNCSLGCNVMVVVKVLIPMLDDGDGE